MSKWSTERIVFENAFPELSFGFTWSKLSQRMKKLVGSIPDSHGNIDCPALSLNAKHSERSNV
jgi:hypothetical protein